MDEKKNYDDYEMPSLNLGGNSSDLPEQEEIKKPEEIKEPEKSKDESSSDTVSESTEDKTQDVDDIVKSITSAPIEDMEFTDYMERVNLSNITQYQRPMPKVKMKKSRKGLFVTLGLLATLLCGLGACYNYVPQVKNFINVRVMTAKSYNKFVEKNTANALTVQYDNGNAYKDNDINAEVLVETSEGNFEGKINRKNNVTLMTGKTTSDDMDFTFYADENLKEYYLQAPALSENTLQISSILIDEILGSANVEQYISEEKAKDLLLRYSEILCKNVSGVKKNVNGKAYINGNSYKQTKITYKLSSYDITDTLSDLLDDMRNDKELINYFEINGFEKEQIDKIQGDLSMISKGIYGEFPYTCEVEKYVDNKGVITGLKYVIYNNIESVFDFGFNLGQDSDSADAYMWMNQGHKAIISASLTSKLESGKYSGSASIAIEGKEYFNVSFDNLKFITSKGNSLINGNIEFNVEKTDYILHFSSEDKNQLIEFNVKTGDAEKTLGTLKLKFTADDISKPQIDTNKIDMITDKDELNKYLSSFSEGLVSE